MLQPPPLARVVSSSVIPIPLILLFLRYIHPLTRFSNKTYVFTHLWGSTEAHQLPPCMLARGGSSPTALAPATKQTKQTSLDSYSRPSMRLARKEVGAKRIGEATPGVHSRPKMRRGVGPDEVGPTKAKAKEKGKQNVTQPQGTPGAPVSDGTVGLSTSTSTFMGTCGFICGKTCTNRSPVCRYLVLKLPTSTGDDFGIVKLLISTHMQLGTHLGARLSCCLKFAACHSAPCHHHIHTTLSPLALVSLHCLPAHP